MTTLILDTETKRHLDKVFFEQLRVYRQLIYLSQADSPNRLRLS